MDELRRHDARELLVMTDAVVMNGDYCEIERDRLAQQLLV